YSKSATNEKGQPQNSQGCNTPKKQIPNRRTGCKAHIILKIDDRGKWVITVVANEHNHELIVSPSKTRFFLSHRSITKEQKELIHMLNEQNISTSQIMSFMQERDGGRHNIHFTRKDLSNKDMEDFMTKDGEPTLWSDDPIEKDARRIYTRILFSEFKTQLRATTGYKLIELEKESLYKISPISCSSSSRQHTHTYMTLENEVQTIKEPSNDLHRIVISQSSRVKQFTSDNMIKDPPHSQCKGRRKPQRLKPQIERKLRYKNLQGIMLMKRHLTSKVLVRALKKQMKKNIENYVEGFESLYAQLC
ncbi:Protein FAR1-RELATED SEQUENCE 5, partial [Ananas comosus]